MENTVMRADEDNRYSWDQIRSTYMDGVLSGRLIDYDNGTTTQVSYVDGVRFSMLQSDSQQGSGVKTWDTIETFYGPDGSVAGRLTMFDNGVSKVESFQNGILSQVAHYDNPHSSGSGAKPWDSIIAYFDAAGDMAARVTTFDNGIVQQEEFEAGIRTRMVQMDNPQGETGTGVKSWDTIETFYDADGVVAARITHYDDGRVRQDSFENGVRTTTEIQDDAYGLSGSQHAWTAINISYDENGKIAAKHTIFDDGRVRQDSYENGVRTETTIEDRFLFNDGNYAWDQQHFTYAQDGTLASKEVAYDDGYAVLTTYQDGLRVQRFEFDGDNSEAWLGRTTTFHEDGSVASTETYASGAELPPDFFVDMPDPAYLNLG